MQEVHISDFHELAVERTVPQCVKRDLSKPFHTSDYVCAGRETHHEILAEPLPTKEMFTKGESIDVPTLIRSPSVR